MVIKRIVLPGAVFVLGSFDFIQADLPCDNLSDPPPVLRKSSVPPGSSPVGHTWG